MSFKLQLEYRVNASAEQLVPIALAAMCQLLIRRVSKK
jgi:hypothetical protein